MRRANRRSVLLLCAFVTFLLTGIALPAQTLTTIGNFTGNAGGAWPDGVLVLGNDGNLYGTTHFGGTQSDGTVFKMTPAGVITTMYSFCSQTGCTDGEYPIAGLVLATDGSFYGTTYLGGTHNGGSIYRITSAGTLTTLYSFCAQAGCTDGKYPYAGALVQGGDGDLYGTTQGGGTHNGGTVFKISTSGALTTLYSFCSQTSCADGKTPESALVLASDDNFYGTTLAGGANTYGTIFKITPSGTLSTLYSFCPQSGCLDGQAPYAGLVQGSDGDFYGTAYAGGAHSSGTVFKITSTDTFSLLYSFCVQSGCPDGEAPTGALIQGSEGNFYGTAYSGGGSNFGGTIFKITPAGAFTKLYTFCVQSPCSDGASPFAGLLRANDGLLYGTTEAGGGVNSAGTVFRLSTSAQGVMTSPNPGSQLTANTVTFSWAPGTQATAYWLDLGSTQGGNSIFQSGNLGNVQTITVGGLPSNGSTIYATLWSLVGGQWLHNDYTYTAFGSAAQKGAVTSPAPGSVLPGSSANFTWTAGNGASSYWIDAGSTPAGNQYFQSGDLGNVLNATVRLPIDGSTVYVTLYSNVAGQWLSNQYTYTAFSVGSELANMQSPAPGSVLHGNAQTFTWSAGSGAAAYWLDVGSSPAGNNYDQSGDLGNTLSTTVYTLPADGSQIYVTLWSQVNGQWYHNDYTYTSAP